MPKRPFFFYFLGRSLITNRFNLLLRVTVSEGYVIALMLFMLSASVEAMSGFFISVFFRVFRLIGAVGLLNVPSMFFRWSLSVSSVSAHHRN